MLIEGRLTIRAYELKGGEKHKAAEVVIARYTDLIAYGTAGVVWRSGRLCSDQTRIRDVNLDDSSALVEGFEGGDRIAAFRVSLDSGQRLD